MIQISAELLALTSEPALLVRGGKLLFANDAACTLLGPDCLNKSFSALFGREIAGMQASAFVGEAEVAGRRFLLRIRAVEGMRAVFLSPCEAAGQLLGDSFLCTLRGELMQLNVSIPLLRSRISPEDAQGLAALFVERIEGSFCKVSIASTAPCRIFRSSAAWSRARSFSGPSLWICAGCCVISWTPCA